MLLFTNYFLFHYFFLFIHYLIFLLVILFSFLLSSIKTLPSLEFSRDIPRITFYSGEVEYNTLEDFYNSLSKPALLRNYYPIKIAGENDPFWWEDNMYIGLLPIVFLLIGACVCFKKYKSLILT